MTYLFGGNYGGNYLFKLCDYCFISICYQLNSSADIEFELCFEAGAWVAVPPIRLADDLVCPAAFSPKNRVMTNFLDSINN